MRHFSSYAQLRAATGEVVAVTDWLTIDQAQIDLFAQATGDHQWIHTDPVRAAQGPFGSTIAHGFLTLSLLPRLMQDAIGIEGATMGVNYGLNKVRFPAPVPAGSRVRAHVQLQAVERVQADGVQITWQVSLEREGSDKPVCVAESLARSYGAAWGDWPSLACDVA